MQLFEHEVPSTWNLYCIGDTHIGSVMCYEKGLKRAVRMIAEDPIGYAVFMGDGIEGICIDDKRFDLDNIDPEAPIPQKQATKLVNILDPIKDKFIAYLFANHDLPLLKFADMAEEVCKKMGRPEIYGTASCKVTFKSKGKTQFKGFFTHGRRSITSNARDPLQRNTQYQIRLKNLMGPLAGDCLLMVRGHNHKLVIADPASELFLKDDGKSLQKGYTQPDPNAEFIHPDLRHYGCSGSFYRTYGVMGQVSYGERAEYPPTETGMLKYTIKKGKLVGGESIVI